MTLKKGQILEGHLTAGENFGRYPTAGGSFLTAESKEKSKKLLVSFNLMGFFLLSI